MTTTTIEYYLSPQSPWTYLGHERLQRIARAAGATIEVIPVDLGGVFPATGGLPLARRAPARQAYRLVELKRFSDHLGLPLNLHPRFFPVDGNPAARLIVAVAEADGHEAALRLAGLVLRAVWVDELDIADRATLASLLDAAGLAPAHLEHAATEAVGARYAANTQRALDAGVFGAPSYVLDGELFWARTGSTSSSGVWPAADRDRSVRSR
ncbi:2-hydroxychromene-2-carboxylate isomerase [Piscinibacter koreensis]|uniref:2-hydroxychromene-2-carboxylate isomerase n=1 Tax=Piscinibacter koreensis TaxID=2742824 RepID=UPI0031590632